MNRASAMNPHSSTSEKTDSVRVNLRDDLALSLGREFVHRLRTE